VHNILFVFFVLAFFAHMAAILIKPNRPMIRAMFTGTMRLDYAKHRHPLWISEVEGHQKASLVRPPAGEVQEERAKPLEEPADPAGPGSDSETEGAESPPQGNAPSGSDEGTGIDKEEIR